MKRGACDGPVRRILGCGFVVLLLLSGGRAAPADPIQAAILAVKADIEQDTAELLALRAEIDAARIPLAARLEQLQQTVGAQRDERDALRRRRREGDAEQAARAGAVAAAKDTLRFMETLLDEYGRAMATRAGSAEAAYLLRHKPVDAAGRDPDASWRFLAADAEDLLQWAMQWNTQRVGGYEFEGTALDARGVEQPGRFAVFGPLAFFASADDGPVGLVVTQFGTDQPAVRAVPGMEAPTAIRRILDGQAARVPVDITGGDALRLREARTGWIEHARKGGLIMIPLLAVGLLALVLSLWKAIELATTRVRIDERVREVMRLARGGQAEAALRLGADIRAPLSTLIAAAILHRDAPREHLEEIMHEHVLGCLPRLERSLGVLAVLGGVAPLLGLLGTVTGMIHTFQLVTVLGSGDARLLSGGISEALVTTEFGLSIAIPVLLFHALLSRRAHTILSILERTAVRLVNDLKIRTGEA